MTSQNSVNLPDPVDELADDLFPNHLSLNVSPDYPYTNEDILLERYLELLNTYTRLRVELNSWMKDGFIEVSRANYVSGKNFGRDYWDEKVVATRKTNIFCKSEKEPEQEPADNAETIVQMDGSGSEKTSSSEEGDDGRKSKKKGLRARLGLKRNKAQSEKAAPLTDINQNQPSSESHKENSASTMSNSDKKAAVTSGTAAQKGEKEEERKEEEDKGKKKAYDPINMFGVLVPYNLRIAQASFQRSIGTMERLVETRREIDELILKLGFDKTCIPAGSSTLSDAT